MKVGERGQVTIPKEIRDRFGFGPETEVEFKVAGNTILLEKSVSRPNLAAWEGYCAEAFKRLGVASVDEFIDDVRGR